MSLCHKCANANCNHEVKPGEVVVLCGDFKRPITNADRIRAMSDEELANWMCEWFDGFGCVRYCPGGEFCNATDGKSNGVKKWLQQPAEEDGHA